MQKAAGRFNPVSAETRHFTIRLQKIEYIVPGDHKILTNWIVIID